MKRPSNIIEQLRTLLSDPPVTRYRISKDTGIEQAVLSRFVRSNCAMSMAAFSTLCDYLGLRLEPTGNPQFKPQSKPKRKGE